MFVGSMQHVRPIAAGHIIPVTGLHIGPVEVSSWVVASSVPESLPLLLLELDPQPPSAMAPALATNPATPTTRNLAYFIG
jgi:hypothetical protein